MKIELSWKTALTAAVIGIGAWTIQRTGWLVYGLERVRHGTTVSVASSCYAIPSGWTSLPPDHSHTSIDLKRHVARGEYTFASLIEGRDIRARVLSAPTVGQRTPNGYTVHDLGAVTGGVSARFGALKNGVAVVVVGQTEVDVRDLVERLSDC